MLSPDAQYDNAFQLDARMSSNHQIMDWFTRVHWNLDFDEGLDAGGGLSSGAQVFWTGSKVGISSRYVL